jgi:hypothetical protein
MKAYEGSECIDPRFLDRGTNWRWVVNFTPRPLYPGERAPGTHCIGGWVYSRTCLDDAERRKFLTLPRLELRTLCRPARRYSLYRLRYPGSCSQLSTYFKRRISFRKADESLVCWDETWQLLETCTITFKNKYNFRFFYRWIHVFYSF